MFQRRFFDATKPVLQTNDRSYRYGDGFFETIKVLNGKILLASYHKKRMEQSFSLLNYKLTTHTTIDFLFNKIIDLCAKNNCTKSARVRISFSNGSGGLYDEDLKLNYIIEASPLPEFYYPFNENGLITGFFTDIKKSCDVYANIKSSSAFLYTVAARQIKQNKWNDCIILNQKENVCESSIANIFWIKDNRIFTPSLTEGCVDGVMRDYLIDAIKTVTETPCRIKDLLDADEVFVTNAIKGIRWIKSIDNRSFGNNITKRLYQEHIVSLLQ